MEIIKDESNYNIIDWWKKVVIENYANFEGRARRSEYWYFVLAQFLLNIIAMFFGAFIVEGIGADGLISVFAGVYILALLALFIPSLAVGVRRLHDTGKSGWFYLLSLIPLGGIVLFVFFIQDSEPGSNKWGENPKEDAFTIM